MNYLNYPKGWNVNKLKEIGTFRKGKCISTSDTISSGNKAIMYGDIYIKYNTMFNDTDYRISDDTSKLSTQVYTNDLLFTCSGETALEIGKCITYTGAEKLYAGGDILIFTPNKDNSMFLTYQQNSFPIIKQKARLGQGHSVVHIYENQIGKIKIVLPPLKEQNNITQILITADNIITQTIELIKQKQEQKKYIMKELLSGNIRLKGFEEVWENVKLEGIINIVNGYAFEGSKYIDNGKYSVVTIGNVKDNKFDLNNVKKVTALPLNINNKQILKVGDILISMTGNVGRVCRVDNENCLLNQRVGKIECINVNNSFILQILIQNHFKYKMIAYSQGGAQANIGVNDIYCYKINLPPLPEQIAIANILECADKEIELLESKLNEYKLLKRSLMQLLLTGIVRTV